MKLLFRNLFWLFSMGCSVVSQGWANEPLRLLTEHNPPGGYRDDSGEVTGPTVELIRILQQRINEPGQIELMPWSRALSVARESHNTALFETVYTDERAPWFKWVGPLKIYTISLYGLKHRLGSDPAKIAFPGKLIACNYRNSATAEDIIKLGFVEGRNLVLTGRAGDCLNMLLFQRVDLIAVTEHAFDEFDQQIQAAGSELIKVRQLSERRRYLAFSPDVSDERIQHWQQALEQSYRDGTMRKLYQPVFSEPMIQRLERFAAKPKR
jgi:polar amino acid transport system substrate-binding protein